MYHINASANGRPKLSEEVPRLATKGMPVTSAPSSTLHGPPAAPFPPDIAGLMKETALLCWPPFEKSVERIVMQAMPVKKAGVKANFKKFSVKTGGRVKVITHGADKVYSEVISDLESGTYYVFRLVVANVYGAVEGMPTAAMRTPAEGEDDIQRPNSREKKLPKRKSKLSVSASDSDEAAGDGAPKDRRASRDPSPTPSGHRRRRSSLLSLLKGKGSSQAFNPSPADAIGPAMDPAVSDDETPDSSPRASARHQDGEEQAEPSAEHVTPPSPVEVTSEVEKKAAVPQSKSIAKRLGGVGRAELVREQSVLEAAEQRQKVTAQLFQTKKEDTAHSRIYQALHPQKLWYESPRQRMEQEDDDASELGTLKVRGVTATADVVRDYAIARDDEGNICPGAMVEESEEDTEDSDVEESNLPDFGEFQKEMDEMRARRAKAQDAHRAELARQWQEKKQREAAALEAELSKINVAEAARKKKAIVTDDEVKAAQDRVAAEIGEHMNFSFSFN